MLASESRADAGQVDELQFDPPTLNKRLLNLRRRGEANGGLLRDQRVCADRGRVRPW